MTECQIATVDIADHMCYIVPNSKGGRIHGHASFQQLEKILLLLVLATRESGAAST